MTDRVFRFSETTTFLNSRMQYLRKYIQHYEPAYPLDGTRPMQTFDVGVVGHKGLQAYYRDKSEAVIKRAMKFQLHTQRVHDSEKACAQDSYGAVDRYIRWLAESGADRNHTTVMMEQRLEMDMGVYHGDRVILTGQPDRAFTDQFGLLHGDDWKFVDKFGSLASYVTSNRQMLTYAMLLQAHFGQPIVSMTLSQINRKPLKTKAFVPASRATTWITPEMLRQHRVYLDRILADMVQLHQEVESGDESGAYPNPGFLCSKMCSYFDVCCGSMGNSPEETQNTLNTRFRKQITKESGQKDENIV